VRIHCRLDHDRPHATDRTVSQARARRRLPLPVALLLLLPDTTVHLFASVPRCPSSIFFEFV